VLNNNCSLTVIIVNSNGIWVKFLYWRPIKCTWKLFFLTFFNHSSLYFFLFCTWANNFQCYSIWFDPRSTALEASTLTITSPMRFSWPIPIMCIRIKMTAETYNIYKQKLKRYNYYINLLHLINAYNDHYFS
jgi:hypothetical protein